jgi:hypothetical protein
MNKLIIVIGLAAAFIGCGKESLCDCTYYSADKIGLNGDWEITYESPWDASCGDEEFGTSKFTYNGMTSYTKTYTRCK